MKEAELEKIKELQNFLEADLWYAFHAELKTEELMLRYLRIHFDILFKELMEMKK